MKHLNTFLVTITAILIAYVIYLENQNAIPLLEEPPSRHKPSTTKMDFFLDNFNGVTATLVDVDPNVTLQIQFSCPKSLHVSSITYKLSLLNNHGDATYVTTRRESPTNNTTHFANPFILGFRKMRTGVANSKNVKLEILEVMLDGGVKKGKTRY